ncbi:N-acetyltransferase [Streptomyces sp. KL2]|uniref:N-acetyltransferase n=1 Tax=Streptomyces sp. KL2 TaxID=3050126 RepID=UPI00397C7D58
MTDTGSLTLRRTGSLANGVRDLLLDLNEEVRGDFGLLGEPFNSRERFGERLDSYASRPGWETVIGYQGDEPVGCAFGGPLVPGTRWWSSMLQPMPEDFTREDGTRTFAVQEVMVRGPWRGSAGAGTSRLLHETLLAERAERRATLLVDPSRSDGRLKAVYESWGYRNIGDQQPFPDSPRFATMVRDPLKAPA